jgi:hypothetical protein
VLRGSTSIKRVPAFAALYLKNEMNLAHEASWTSQQAATRESLHLRASIAITVIAYEARSPDAGGWRDDGPLPHCTPHRAIRALPRPRSHVSSARARAVRFADGARRRAALRLGITAPSESAAEGRDPEIHADRALPLRKGCRHLGGKTHRPPFDVAPKDAAFTTRPRALADADGSEALVACL